MDDRSSRYLKLVTERKACTECEGITNASAMHNGKFDSDQIGPWSRWLGDLEARVLVVGQDWGDRRAFVTQEGRDSAKSATNRMLQSLLASIGGNGDRIGDQGGRKKGVQRAPNMGPPQRADASVDG